MATSRAQPNGVSTPNTTGPRPTTKTHDHEKISQLLASSTSKSETGESLLWVCHFCFKYMSDGIPWELHKKDCKMKSPPGKKVYQRGAHIIWEVDGAKEKLYCQNLSLFGKLFIDVKTLFFDCDNFLFYILTDAKSSEDHIIGFFSKEKVSYDDCNLACILTLPQYQRKGYGMLMIEFSYELSRREGKMGSPERPLSQLGLRGYLSYWISTLVRFFRRVLSTLSPEIAVVRNRNAFPSLKDGEEVGEEVELMKDVKIPKKKSTKGFDGETSEASVEARLCTMPLKYIQGLKDPMFSTQRIFETKRQEDGSAVTHVKIECTLADISRATCMKEQDIAFALNEIGLLSRRLKAQAKVQENGDVGSETPEDLAQIRIEDTFVVTRSMIEQVAKERHVKIMILDRACVLV
ncbi:hypothetical protein CVT24_010933 [Panaeolus cyanescens]|uniref:histone acetyltransferase n=1 Tax=Panaeolus cyanescens TaxID=181874 RepID=A0A409WDE1_9AGAR|nr:hypothetical protein CVT24_010933 [Panaeolus cyanescens]